MDDLEVKVKLWHRDSKYCHKIDLIKPAYIFKELFSHQKGSISSFDNPESEMMSIPKLYPCHTISKIRSEVFE